MTDAPAEEDPPAGQDTPEAKAPAGSAENQPSTLAEKARSAIERALRHGERAVRRMSPQSHVVAGGAAVLLLSGAVTWWFWAPEDGVGVVVDEDSELAELADLTEDFPTDEEAAPAQPPEIPSVSEDAEWEISNVDGDSASLAVAGDGYVLITDEKLVGLDDSGSQTWEHELDEEEVSVSDQVVMLVERNTDDDSWPGKKNTTVLDSANGTPLWEDTAASFVSLRQETLYASVCQGGQDGELGECRLSAKDPRSGAVRWTQDTYASTKVVNAELGPGMVAVPHDASFVVIESFVTGGHDRKVTALDSATGARLGVEYDGSQQVLATERTLVRASDDDNPADGCTSTLTGWSTASGSQAWEREVGVPEAADGSDCYGISDSGQDARIAVGDEDGYPAVLNLDSGQLEYTATDKGDAVLATDELLLAMNGEDDGALLMYDVSDDEPSWQQSAWLDPYESRAFQVSDSFLVLKTGGESDCWQRFDLTDGEAEAYPGACGSSGPGWVTVTPDLGDEGADLRLFAVE